MCWGLARPGLNSATATPQAGKYLSNICTPESISNPRDSGQPDIYIYLFIYTYIHTYIYIHIYLQYKRHTTQHPQQDARAQKSHAQEVEFFGWSLYWAGCVVDCFCLFM